MWTLTAGDVDSFVLGREVLLVGVMYVSCIG